MKNVRVIQVKKIDTNSYNELYLDNRDLKNNKDDPFESNFFS